MGGGRVSPIGFLFERKGIVRVAPIEGQEAATFDALFEAALEGGAEDVREVETEDGTLWEVSHGVEGPTMKRRPAKPGARLVPQLVRFVAGSMPESGPFSSALTLQVVSAPTDLGTLTTLFTSPPHDMLYTVQTSELAYLANDLVPVTEDGEGVSVAEAKVETVMKGINALEEEADVVRVWTNIE